MDSKPRTLDSMQHDGIGTPVVQTLARKPQLVLVRRIQGNGNRRAVASRVLDLRARDH
jgi:hypothetical protein